MTNATPKQIRALKALNKFPRIKSEYLQDINIDSLEIDQASDLIGRCRELEKQLKSGQYTQSKPAVEKVGQGDFAFC